MKLTILILEDEPEVRTAVERDLQVFAPTVRLEPASDVADARSVDHDGAGLHAAVELYALFRYLDHLSVFGDNDVFRRNAHELLERPPEGGG